MSHAIRAFVLFTALFTGTLAAAEAPTEKWRILFQGGATSDGNMQFRVTPQAGEPLLFNIKVTSGQGTMAMAKVLLAGIKAQLPKSRFKSEILHIQEVLLKAGHGEPAFTLELVESTVTGAKVVLGPA
jgi:hypothetical protein